MPRKIPKLGAPLTERELKILKALSEGKIRKQLPDIIGKSIWCVELDYRCIFAKMGTTNMLAIVCKLIREGAI